MKFKEIKPGMTIHCPKKKNAKKLLKHLKKLGYTLYGEEKFMQDARYGFGERTCYEIEKDMTVIYADIGYFKDRGYEITEFSDLVWQEPSAVELLKFFMNTTRTENLRKLLEEITALPNCWEEWNRRTLWSASRNGFEVKNENRINRCRWSQFPQFGTHENIRLAQSGGG